MTTEREIEGQRGRTSEQSAMLIFQSAARPRSRAKHGGDTRAALSLRAACTLMQLYIKYIKGFTRKLHSTPGGFQRERREAEHRLMLFFRPRVKWRG